MTVDIYYEPPEQSVPLAGNRMPNPTELLIGQELSSMSFTAFMDKVQREAQEARAEYFDELRQEQAGGSTVEVEHVATSREEESTGRRRRPTRP